MCMDRPALRKDGERQRLELIRLNDLSAPEILVNSYKSNEALGACGDISSSSSCYIRT